MANEENLVTPVDLGFLKTTKPALLKNCYFPSKVGGKPAWLELANLPKYEDIECPKCKNPRIFLCQIYAPIETRDDCFHRTIFIFICNNESCFELNNSKNIVAFRSQLPKNNKFYSLFPVSPTELDDENTEIKGPLNLCHVCGCHGKFSCSLCKNINYCGVIHQKLDWKNHKLQCNKKQNIVVIPSIKLLPEYEIEIGEEEEEEEDNNENNEESNLLTEQILNYENYINYKKSELQDVPESELLEYVKDIEDEHFTRFKEICENEPTQVIRYARDGEPLWLTDKNIINENDIPNCEYCNSERIFEFQIMPQMLNFLQENNLDWGVLAIYTCSESCNTNSQYLKEYVVKQDIV